MLTATQVKFRNEMLLYNLRFRWKNELAHIADRRLVQLYDDFAVSEFYGNNDEHFLQFVTICID